MTYFLARCVDQPSCKQWKADGRCQARRFRAQMEAACPLACGYCVPGKNSLLSMRSLIRFIMRKITFLLYLTHSSLVLIRITNRCFHVCCII